MAEQITSYLKQLKFDPKLAMGPVAQYLSNVRLVLMILFSIVGIGIYSYVTLPRSLNPEVKIPIVLVSTVLPGSGPKDVESLVTIPLEDGIQGVSNIKTVTSTSMNSVSAIQVEFNSGVDPDKAASDIQAAVNGVSGLPSDAQTPKVQKLDFENQPVLQFSIATNSDVGSLTRFSKDLQTKLKDLKSIKDVSVSGLEDQEVQILIKPEAISAYKLSPPLLSQAIKSAASAIPAGSINTDTSTFSLTIDSGVTNVDDVRKLKINLNGSVVSLGDIAVVSQRSKPGQSESYIANSNIPPSRSVNFSVFRNKSVNIDQAVAEAQKAVNEDLNQYNGQFKMNTILDTSADITTQTSELQRDFLLTIALVFAILFIFLGVRQASVALLATPLTFFITFTIMKITGISLNFLSQFSLLLSLGLLVDDTIVVISAMSSYYRTHKFTPLQTGLLVWNDFFTPILTTTITTVWAFVPLLLATGIIGEFIKPIPIVVSTTLLASFFVAMLLTLPLLIIFLKPNLPRRVSFLLRIFILAAIVGGFIFLVPKSTITLLQVLALLVLIFVFVNAWPGLRDRLRQRTVRQRDDGGEHNYIEHGVFSFSTIDNAYQRLISKILNSKSNRRKTILMVVIFSLFSYLLLPLGLVQNEFFPKTDQDILYVQNELPAGTNLDVSKAETQTILEELRHTPGTKFVTADVGQAFDAMGGVSGSTSNEVLFTLTLIPHHDRNITSTEIADQLRQKFGSYTKGKLSVQELSGGPPAGADLQIKLSGDDLSVLDNYAKKIQDYLKTVPGATNVDQSIKSGTSKITFVPDNTKLAAAGLDPGTVGLYLRTFASGFDGPKLRLAGDTEDTDSTFRFSSQTSTVQDIGKIMIPSQGGQSYPLNSLGQLVLEPNPTLITRENGKRTLSVTAAVTAGHSVTELNKKLEDYAKSINLPAGYSWSTGGVNEQNNDSVTSILQAMILSFLLIIVTMVVQFSSFRKALIVMLVIPLSISGVFIIFALTHTPLSFPALIGVLALFGIVVKNSILVVDKISVNIKTGMGFIESIVDGSVSRLEAITLTSLATIAGLTPITLSDPLWRGLGGAIIAGLTFSGTIMLFFIPVVYYFLFRGEQK
jgi:multidrug efflux pump subunit AcrB